MTIESEEEKSLKALERDPKKFLESCKNGPRVNVHLQTLLNHVERIPKAHALETLMTFNSHILPGLPLSKESARRTSGKVKKGSSKETDLPFLAIKGIGRMSPFLQVDPSLRCRLVELLPMMAITLQYFMLKVSKDDSHEFESVFTTLLESLVNFEDIREVLVKDPIIRFILIVLWLEVDENAGLSTSLTRLLDIFIQDFLSGIGTLKQCLKEILDLSANNKDGYKTMVREVIRRLHAIDSLPVTEKSPSDILPSLQVLLILSEEPTLCKTIVEFGGLAPVIKLSAFIFETASPRELVRQNTNFHINDFFRRLFTIFKRISMEMIECISHLADAINDGMIRVFAHACDTLDLLDEDATFYVTAILFRFTRLMLVHDSVLVAVIKELKKLHALPCAEKLTSGVLQAEWVAFQDSSLVHYGSLRYYEIVLCEARKHRLCDACRKGDLKGAFQCCAKCKNAFYCSKECQLKAWKGGHKQQCSDLIGSRGKDVAGSKNISYLCALELKRHWPSLQKNPKVTSTPFSRVVFDLDWTSMPPSPIIFRVYTVDELMQKLLAEKDFVEVSMLKEMQSVTEIYGNTQAITRISVMTGSGIRTSISSIGKVELLSPGLERPAIVHLARPVAKDEEGNDLTCIWDEVDEAIHRLGLPNDGTLLVNNGKGRRVHAFSMVDDVLSSPSFPIPMNVRLAKSFGKFGLQSK